MEPSPGPWISALRHSHDRLRASAEPLGPDQLTQRSYPRLVYGRLDEAHTPPAETAGVELDELRQIFRGF